MRLSPCVLVQPDGWARGEREGYVGPRDVTSLSLSLPETIHKTNHKLPSPMHRVHEPRLAAAEDILSDEL